MVLLRYTSFSTKETECLIESRSYYRELCWLMSASQHFSLSTNKTGNTQKNILDKPEFCSGSYPWKIAQTRYDNFSTKAR
jgi:hypothetical protein